MSIEEIKSLSVKDRIEYLVIKNGWCFGSIIKNAKEGVFFEYSEDFEIKAKSICREVFFLKKKESAKKRFDFMKQLYKENPKVRQYQYDTAKFEFELWEELLAPMGENY